MKDWKARRSSLHDPSEQVNERKREQSVSARERETKGSGSFSRVMLRKKALRPRSSKPATALTKLLGRTPACSCRTLLCRIATIHCTLGAALSITQLVLIVTFRRFAMVFGCCFMIACSLFMETASFLDIWHDVCSLIREYLKSNAHEAGL